MLYVILITGLMFLFMALEIHSEENKIMEITNNIHWLGHATVKISISGKTIYIDPYQIKKTDQADIILITHSHSDHLSPGDISKISSPNTIIIAPEDCLAKIKNIPKEKTITSEPGFKKQVGGILIEAVPAYNIIKTNFHPKENQWVGYVLTLNGIKIYHAGDTERIPEMKDFDCDIALLPLGQTYTMNSVKEAAEAAIDVKAKVAIPIHYGLYEGQNQDAREFKSLLKDKIKVIIKEKE
ncbi:MAG: MBL fold metallo-hydrolase [Candidatus Aminicenantes bacterium]|nr:MBL fold metallo-hydrolase [Candidatus Aminicenantes bacterium]